MRGASTPRRILILGGGGREHALAWKLAAEPGVEDVVVAPGSGAIETEPRVRCLRNLEPIDPSAVVRAARSEAVDLVVIGPEAPLAVGVADALVAAGIPIFGPSRAAARLETSKAFCHEIAEAAGVPMARARGFAAGEFEEARAFAADLASSGHGLVVKADGLAAGKGVVVCDDVEAAWPHMDAHLARYPGDPRDGTPYAPRVVLEERLFGHEASVIAVADGQTAVALPAARDHKRLCDGDTGPNTGGMGAYSPLADLPDDTAAGLLDTIHRPILAELSRRGTLFRGFLYTGLILTEDGPVLLECNVRLGDPEAQVILSRLAEPLAPILWAAANGDLRQALAAYGIDGNAGAAALPARAVASVGIVLAARGYPGTPKRGAQIEGLDEARDLGALIFHAGTFARPGGGYATNGGRVLAVVARADNLADARVTAERAADAIAWDGLQRRRDIAANPPEPKAAVVGSVR